MSAKKISWFHDSDGDLLNMVGVATIGNVPCDNAPTPYFIEQNDNGVKMLSMEIDENEDVSRYNAIFLRAADGAPYSRHAVLWEDGKPPTAK